MFPKLFHLYSLILLVVLSIIHNSEAQPDTYGFTCTTNSTTINYPCQTYVLYRPESTDLLDLASIGDLFNVSRLSISKPSNILDPSSSLVLDQPLLIPVTCGCHSVLNQTLKALSFASMTYTIKPGDSFYYVSTHYYGNLTTYQSSEVVNPTLGVLYLEIGNDAYFPIFCKCPTITQLRNNVNFLVSYVVQPDDSLGSIAEIFRVPSESIIAANVGSIQPFETVFVPVSKLVKLDQPPSVPTNNNHINGGSSNQTVVVNSDHKGAVFGLGVGFSVLLLVLVTGLLIYREIVFRKRLKERDLEGTNEGQRKTLREYSNVHYFSYQELNEATNGFEEELGRGSFGIVYKGMISGGGSSIHVAVKKLDRISGDTDKEFKTEVNVIGQTHHKNLVQLVGFCKEGHQRLLVYEYMSNCSLADYLFGGLKPSWIERVQITQGIARGLLYLHEECSTQIIHCDIKPQNILLDEYQNARISDFGLAKLLVLNQTHTNTAIRGTKGYVAPEWFRNKPVTVKVDVYSFGVLLLEIISCRKSICMELIEEEGAILTDWAFDCYQSNRLDLLVNNDMEVLNDVIRLKKFVMIALWCIQEDPNLRPTMRTVTQMLEGLAEVPNNPPSPTSFSATTQY